MFNKVLWTWIVISYPRSKTQLFYQTIVLAQKYPKGSYDSKRTKDHVQHLHAKYIFWMIYWLCRIYFCLINCIINQFIYLLTVRCRSSPKGVSHLTMHLNPEQGFPFSSWLERSFWQMSTTRLEESPMIHGVRHTIIVCWPCVNASGIPIPLLLVCR